MINNETTSRVIYHRVVTKHDTHDTANEQIHSRAQNGPQYDPNTSVPAICASDVSLRCLSLCSSSAPYACRRFHATRSHAARWHAMRPHATQARAPHAPHAHKHRQRSRHAHLPVCNLFMLASVRLVPMA